MTGSGRRQERKVVTVLFCDLVGFTQRSEEMDPEDVASLLAPYHARVKEDLERHGGTVEKFIGDAVMALFGAPVAHEDDPERAVRAALAIRDYAREQALELRIGVTTGDALVTIGARPDQGETMATGDVVNTASRLQAAAPVNGVLVGERTHAATQTAIDYRDHEHVVAKGKSRPLPAFEAVSARAARTLGPETPLVGREQDLRLLTDTLSRVERERSCQLVTLVGVPGVGKSRLVRELATVGPEATWREGRCLSYGDGGTLQALAEIVRAELEIHDSDSDEIAERRLTEAVADEWVRTQLRPLVGLGVEGIGEGDGRDQGFIAWRRFLEGAAEKGALALVFEDLHWADEDLLDFVDHLVDWTRDVPLLVVCTARPEFLERRPSWGGGKSNALTISLSHLSHDETARLLDTLTASAPVPTDAREELLRRVGGNPLYAEQFARLLVDSARIELPETVGGMIAARLDLLEPAPKELLQVAAVIGDQFWLDGVASISDLDVHTTEAFLHGLERKGFVHRLRESSANDPQYAFTHVLVREAAYEQIPRRLRSEIHGRTAAWIESIDRRADHSELLAHHYLECLAFAKAANQETQGLDSSAARALREAGERALALNAYARALRHFEQALELFTEAGAERAQLLRGRAKANFHAAEGHGLEPLEEAREALLAAGDRESAAEMEILEARVLLTRNSFAEASQRARRALARLGTAPPSPAKAYVLANCARVWSVAGLGDEALDLARGALAMSEQLGLDELRANVLGTIGIVRVARSDFDGLDDLEEGYRIAAAHASPDEILRDCNNLAWSYVGAGRWSRASEWFLAGLDAAERFGLGLAVARATRTFDRYMRGDWHEATRLAEEVLADESRHLDDFVIRLRATIRTARGDVEGSARDFSDFGSRVDSGDRDPVVLIWFARGALEQGRNEQAAELADEALDRVDEWLGLRPAIELIDLAFLSVELGLPSDRILDRARGAPASPWYPVAANIATGDLVSAAHALAGFGASAYAAYARLRAAERLAVAGRAVEADEQARKALSFYRSVEADSYVQKAEALLAAVS